MIPLTLKITNFLSYGNQTQTINFAPYKLICLSGKNGHGKSALLDALTWVIWGQARKISAHSKPDQGLVHLGEMEMTVSLDFIFNACKYRIKRDFSQKYGKPNAHIEFGMLDATTDRFISLTDKTIRKTQEKIETTIGLDYDTFINTCFLRQGQSHEFSKKSPKERKEILGTILGLNHYDQTRKVILESMKEIQNKIDQQAHIQERITQEIESLVPIIQEDQTITEQLATLETSLHTLHKQEQELKVKEQEYLKKEQERTLLTTQYHTLADTIKHKEELIQRSVTEWRTVHKQLLSMSNYEKEISHQKELEKEAHILSSQLHHFLHIKNILLELKQKIIVRETEIQAELNHTHNSLQTERITLETMQKNDTQRLQELHKKNELQTTEAIDITRDLKQLLMQIPSSFLLYESEELTTLFEKHKTLYRRWIERANRCKQEIEETTQKIALSQDIDNPSCPLCEQNLSQARKKFLHKKLEEHHHFLMHRFNKLKVYIAQLKEHLHIEHTALQLIETKKKYTEKLHTLEKDKEALALQEADLNQAIATRETQLHTIAQEYTHLTTIYESKKLADHLLQELYNSCKQYELELLSYDAVTQQYQTIQKTLETLSTKIKEYEKLTEELHLQKERRMQIRQYSIERRSIKKELKALDIQKKIYASLDEEKKEIIYTTNLLKTTHDELTNQQQQLIKQKAIINHAQEKQRILEQERATLEENKKSYITAHAQEQLLAQAFSKDGIQALLIEEALPELESYANELLGRLTDNQAHISIESLRDLKKGGSRETLDINISDAQGVRPYELFSGGEAFRIDFALRIAISQLLARKAGTSLQTLIIDEGFGSQDDEGLTRIMDALYAIQDDFEKIIIVSHLSSLKEQFPVHFVVQKKPHGSTVSVFEQD